MIAGLCEGGFNKDVTSLSAGYKWSLEKPVLANRMMNSWIGNGHEGGDVIDPMASCDALLKQCNRRSEVIGVPGSGSDNLGFRRNRREIGASEFMEVCVSNVDPLPAAL